MADNYLEKKMEEFRSGKKAIRRPSHRRINGGYARQWGQ